MEIISYDVMNGRDEGYVATITASPHIGFLEIKGSGLKEKVTLCEVGDSEDLANICDEMAKAFQAVSSRLDKLGLRPTLKKPNQKEEKQITPIPIPSEGVSLYKDKL
jgi:hypothetical protein